MIQFRFFQNRFLLNSRNPDCLNNNGPPPAPDKALKQNQREWEYLHDLNMHIIEFFRKELRIETPLCYVSEIL
jgi:hypothetical protein